MRKWEENAGFRAKFARVERRGGREEAWDEVRGCAFASSESINTPCARVRACVRVPLPAIIAAHSASFLTGELPDSPPVVAAMDSPVGFNLVHGTAIIRRARDGTRGRLGGGVRRVVAKGSRRGVAVAGVPRMHRDYVPPSTSVIPRARCCFGFGHFSSGEG